MSMSWVSTKISKLNEKQTRASLPTGLRSFGNIDLINYQESFVWGHPSGSKAISFNVSDLHYIYFCEIKSEPIAFDLIQNFKDLINLHICSTEKLELLIPKSKSIQFREYGILDIQSILLKPPSRVRRWWQESKNEAQFEIESMTGLDFERLSMELKKFSMIKSSNFLPDVFFIHLMKNKDSLENIKFAKIELNGVTTKGFISTWEDAFNIDFNWSMSFDKQSLNHTAIFYKSLMEWGLRSGYKKMGLGIVNWHMNGKAKDEYRGVREFKSSWKPELHPRYVYSL